jgi:hypothetical protein
MLTLKQSILVTYFVSSQESSVAIKQSKTADVSL